jgi:N-acetylmuramic acid 6-phosphate etherase
VQAVRAASAVMVRLYKVHGNLMVDLRASNSRLRQRTAYLTMRASATSEQAARQMLETCAWRVKVAIVALGRCTDAAVADALLARQAGSIRRALSD